MNFRSVFSPRSRDLNMRFCEILFSYCSKNPCLFFFITPLRLVFSITLELFLFLSILNDLLLSTPKQSIPTLYVKSLISLVNLFPHIGFVYRPIVLNISDCPVVRKASESGFDTLDWFIVIESILREKIGFE